MHLPHSSIHSDKDYRCVVTDGLAAFKTLRYQGVPARYLTFPDENHFVLKPDNSLVWHKVSQLPHQRARVLVGHAKIC